MELEKACGYAERFSQSAHNGDCKDWTPQVEGNSMGRITALRSVPPLPQA